MIEYVNAQQIMKSWLSSESRDYVAKSKQTVVFQDVTRRHKVTRRKDDRKKTWNRCSEALLVREFYNFFSFQC